MISINIELQNVARILSSYRDVMDYRLVTSKSNGHFQYSYRDADNKLIYIKSKDIELAKRLAEKEYYVKVQSKLLSQRYAINKFLAVYDKSAVYKVYDDICEGRKALFKSVYKSDEEYIEAWMEAHQGNQNTLEATVKYTTNKGELVRSKSEKILADLFNKHGVPYQYEPRVELKDGKVCYPDFILLNVKERKTYYWEHFGLASDKEYSEKNLDKLCRYEQSGMIIGDNLIVSMESVGTQLDMISIEAKIKKYLI